MPLRVRPSELTARLHRRELEAAAELQERLKAAQRQIAAKIEAAAERRAAATSMAAREALQDEVAETYESLNQGIDDWLKDLTEKTAVEWHGMALTDIRNGRARRKVAHAFSRDRVRRYWEIIHPDNTTHLAAVFTDKMEESDKRNLRQAFLDTFRQQTLGGWTAKETHKELQRRWDAQAKNLRSDRFVDSAGHAWTNAQYLQMLTRTTLLTASRESYTDTLVENGFTFARISDDGDPCPACKAWAGVIVDISGSADGGDFPTIQTARDGGWGHPNCSCRLEYLDETVDRVEIARQRKAPTPEAPDLDPGAPDYREKLKAYTAEVQAYNDGIRIKGKMDSGMSEAEAVTDLKRDKIVAQMRGAFPADPDKAAWVKDVPAAVLEKMDMDAIPRIEPAKRGDTPNSSRDSNLGGVLKLARNGTAEDYLKAFGELQEKRGIPVLPDTDETAEPTGPKVFAKAAKRIADAFGAKADIQNTDSAIVRQHVSDLAKTIGDDTMKALADKGVRIQIANTGVGNMPGAEVWADSIPRGYDGVRNAVGKQATWRDLSGGYFPHDKTVRLGSGIPHGSVNGAAHEGAHAIGDVLGIDNAPELIEHHKRLFEKLDPYFQQDGPGGRAGRQEMLAEAAAWLREAGEKKALTRYDEEFIVWLKKVLGQ